MLGEKIADQTCQTAHLQSEDANGSQKCPKPGCEKLFKVVPDQVVCPSCGFLLSKCSSCGTLNRHGNGFCRHCGKQNAFISTWPQEGGNQARSGLPRSGTESGLILTASSDWDPHLECENAKIVSGLLPAPVVAQDILIYYNPHVSAMEARSTCANTKNFGKVLWRSSLSSQELLAYASSPVVYESILYFVTDQPKYMHRLALSTGNRQVCSIELNGQKMDEIPGDILPNTPPLLFDLQKRAVHKTGVSKTLVLLTTAGICIFDLFSLSRSPNPVLSGRYLPAEYQKYKWSKPAAVGSFIVSTSQTQPAVLYIDMTNYPEDVYQQIIELKMLPPDYKWNSPCIGTPDAIRHADNSVCWYTTDVRNQTTMLIFFRPPGFINTTEIPFAGKHHRDLENCLGPVCDSETVYVPYFNEKKNSVGLTSCEGVGKVMHIDLPPPGISPLFATVAEHTLIHPGQKHLYKLDARVLKSELKSCGVFADSETNTICCSRPILAGSHVFVQCSKLISCFEMNKRGI